MSGGQPALRSEIVAELDLASRHIVWHCTLCGDNGLIHGWEDTPWDRQHDAGAAPTSTRRRRHTDASSHRVPRRHPAEPQKTHNARHQRTADSRCLSASVPRVIASDRGFLAQIRRRRRFEKLL